uniref:Uncharacterized protein n=1 Tax=Panagrolaimus sp. PS1159 TaxID=55785 RepID=A0AC35EU45_9BILA
MKLITLDRSKNVTYFGECKIQYQEIEKCLNITLLDKVPEETMTATFHRVFVRRNNLLCCMNPNFNNVMIITDEVNYLFNNLPGTLLVQTPVSTETEETFVRQKRIVKPQHLTPEPETSSLHPSRTIFGSFLPSNIDKRSIKEDDEEEEKAVGTSHEKLKASRKSSRKTLNGSCLTSSNTPNVSKLLVFTSNARKQCYEFMFIQNSCFFRCIKCLEQKKDIILKTTRNLGCRNFDFNTSKHVCEPIVYLPKNYGSSLIIKAPNFKLLNGRIHPSLIIFNSGDKNLCYKFRYDNSQIVYYCSQCMKQSMKLTARFIQHGGENAIELNRLNHLCQPKKYIL